MKRSDLTEFEIEEKDLKLRICRQSAQEVGPTAAHMGAVTTAPFPVVPHGSMSVPQQPPAGPDASASSSGGAAEETDVDYIRSPMVGTFYRAPSPENDPFVENGQKVSPDTVVCIIEAMKVMNEIQAERGGIIQEILVENGEPVEYNQPLFKLKTK